MNRRNFIKHLSVAGSGLALGGLTGCSTMDSFFGIEKKSFDKEVLIFGGGLAGLSAAFELKKRGLPYRVYEASNSIGGRVKTIRHFNTDSQFVELGGEFISSSHLFTKNICSDLKLKFFSVESKAGKRLPRQMVLLNGQLLSSAQWLLHIQKFAGQLTRMRLDMIGDQDGPFSNSSIEQNPKFQTLDRTSLEELILVSTKTLGNDVTSVLRNGLLSQYGKPLSQVSSFDFLRSLRTEDIDGTNLLKVEGGNSLIHQTLYDRIAGVIPNYLVKFSSPLIGVKRNGKKIVCKIQGEKGVYTVEAKKIIIAIPLSQLNKIEGLSELISDDRLSRAMNELKLGNHLKAAFGFKEKFWANLSSGPWGGGLMSAMKSQVGWDSSLGQEGKSGIMTFQLGGPIDFDVQQVLTADLSQISKEYKSASDGQFTACDWSKKKWIEGSISSFGPGQMIEFGGVFNQLSAQGQIAFAGEHTHPLYQGTMNGALESGALAVKKLVDN